MVLPDTTSQPERESSSGEARVSEEIRLSRRASSNDARASDETMMYAWSIGTTRAAQEMPAARREESCPPEVYIG